MEDGSDGAGAPRALLTGATGCVGRHLYPALRAAGFDTRCSSRDPERAQRQMPGRRWVRLDVERPDTFGALRGMDVVFYLVHQMGGRGDYPERETRAALALREAAAAAGVGRIVYLGGVAPTGEASAHLRSRLKTGELLRAGAVPAIELRAGMIIGEGSASWHIVRDLSARLPAMVLPSWLTHHSSPVAIDDVVAALLWAARGADPRSAWYDVAGSEVLSHRALLTRVADQFGRHPAMFQVPVVTPRLSAYWIALVTRIGLPLARELVQGLQSDLVPDPTRAWGGAEAPPPTPLDVAIAHALEAEHYSEIPAPPSLARLSALPGQASRLPS